MKERVSFQTAQRRLRAILRKISRLEAELAELAGSAPCPAPDELAAMLRFETPLTQEARRLGLLRLALFHLAEAGGSLSQALAKTAAGRRQWLRPDVRSSLLDLLGARSDRGREAASLKEEANLRQKDRSASERDGLTSAVRTVIRQPQKT